MNDSVQTYDPQHRQDYKYVGPPVVVDPRAAALLHYLSHHRRWYAVGDGRWYAVGDGRWYAVGDGRWNLLVTSQTPVKRVHQEGHEWVGH